MKRRMLLFGLIAMLAPVPFVIAANWHRSDPPAKNVEANADFLEIGGTYWFGMSEGCSELRAEVIARSGADWLQVRAHVEENQSVVIWVNLRHVAYVARKPTEDDACTPQRCAPPQFVPPPPSL